MKLLLPIVLAWTSFLCYGQAVQTRPKKIPVAPNTLTAIEKQLGWALLFDGKTTTGWHSFNKKTIGSAWKVANGTMYLDTSQKEQWQVKGGGDIVTAAEYSNFHLKLEWKIAPGGNSGIIFFVKEDPKYKQPWLTGPEMQILDNEGHSDGKIIKHRAGDLYDLISCNKESVKPVGDWNKVEIICNKNKLNFFLNGVNVVSAIIWDEDWKKLIAGSKFKEMPDFGTYSSGRIGLQDHGNMVWFRNIKIKKL
jgi:uncharacterized protein YaiE (UPF0345 family)